MPDPLNQREKEPQRVEGLGHVVLIEIGIAKKSPRGVMVISQPGKQGKNWNKSNRSTLESGSYAAIAMRKSFPKRECQRCDDRSLFAQNSQAKSKLRGPDAAFDVKPDSPKRKCSSHKIGMRQRALHKKDWVH